MKRSYTSVRGLIVACIGVILVLNFLVMVRSTESAQSSLKGASGGHAAEAVDSLAMAASEPTTCWFDGPKATRVPDADLEHLSLLHEKCLSDKDAIITWRHGLNSTKHKYPAITHRGDPGALEELRRCPDIDVFLPGGIRGAGYCEDGTAYTKYGYSRLLPDWAIEDEFFDEQRQRMVTYHDLCPKTPIIFMNRYWPNREWPKHKPIYLMPNIEMGQLTPEDYWAVDAVICKTQHCYDRVTQWYAQQGNPRGAMVFYTKHTTADIASYTRRRSPPLAPKKYDGAIRFTHTAGSSTSKGTSTVLDCWLSRPDLPPLDLYMTPFLYDMGYHERQARVDASPNINLHHTGLEPAEFGKVLGEASFFLCASVWEGYGHYINQARAAGGVVITSDGPPMNELIVDQKSGVYVRATPEHHPHPLMGGNYDKPHGLTGFTGLIAKYEASDLCDAVDRVLKMSPTDRARMAANVQQSYHDDTKFFASAMRTVRSFARFQTLSNGSAVDVAASQPWKDVAIDKFPCHQG